ncbi:DUF554 domain-containing protein [Leptothoe spongobia]|uniref:DUF554 domain-containing protein n=1 Tax=Leptothoe spongobia TAU-MAC 1115 TaxID=1967444 RepID=A0A947DFJ8_9CYAN|nr:DUF554 domain-containing protein [Leptothoe spongobia TAU-MAC 1115]
MLSLWAKTSGTWINVALVLLGTVSGLILRGRLPRAMQDVITQAMGLITLFIGIQMAQPLTQVNAGQIAGVIVGMVALVIGGLLGEWWQIEKRLAAIGDWLKTKFGGGSRFTEGFVAASLLYCIGPMAILGSLNNGLSGDGTILIIKGTMDGLISVALTGSYGAGVGFSVLPVAVYQGGLSLLAGLLSGGIGDPATAPSILLVTGVGGVIIMGIGFNLLQVATIRVASFLPALLLTPLFYQLCQFLSV